MALVIVALVWDRYKKVPGLTCLFIIICTYHLVKVTYEMSLY